MNETVQSGSVSSTKQDDGAEVFSFHDDIKSYLNSDGSTVVEHPNGAKIVMLGDGNVTFSLPKIEKVGIDNILNLKSVNHSDDGKTLSFNAVFKDDSSVDFVCDLTTGTIQKFSMSGGSSFTIHKEPGVISFDMR